MLVVDEACLIKEEIFELIPRDICQNHRVVPVSRLENKLFIAMADPLNVLAVDDDKRITRLDVSPMIASGRRTLRQGFSSVQAI